VTAGRRVLLVGVVVVGVAAAVWLGLRRHATSPGAAQPEPIGADAQKFVGKWTFVEGTMKSDWDFQATPQKHEVSLAGKSLTFEERDGALWATLQGDHCSILLGRNPQNATELVSARTVCPDPGSDAAKKAKPKSIDLAISLDASGRGHVTGTSKISIEASGVVHEGHLNFTGVVEKQADADAGH